tara:strand:- start:66 stop:617 length:552 start_codon:yes stop_codon:yes gene_type:complete
MAVYTNSDLITNSTSVPAVMNNVAQSGGRMRISTGSMTIADSAFDADTNVLRCCQLPSNAVIHKMEFYCDDMDNGTDSAVDIGLYNTGDASAPGTVIAVDCYADACEEFRAAIAPGAAKNFRYAGGANNAQLAITTAGDALWQNAGLSEDPGGLMELCLTQTATVSNDLADNAFAFFVMYTVD